MQDNRTHQVQQNQRHGGGPRNGTVAVLGPRPGQSRFAPPQTIREAGARIGSLDRLSSRRHEALNVTAQV